MNKPEEQKGKFIELLKQNEKHISELVSETSKKYFEDIKKNQLVPDIDMKKIIGKFS